MNFDVGPTTIYFAIVDDSGATQAKLLFGGTAIFALLIGIVGYLWLRRRGARSIKALWPLILGGTFALLGAVAISLISADLDTIRELRDSNAELHDNLRAAADGNTVHIVSNEDTSGAISTVALEDMYAEAMRAAVIAAAHDNNVTLNMDEKQSAGHVTYTLNDGAATAHCDTTYTPDGDATLYSTADLEFTYWDIQSLTMNTSTECTTTNK